MRNDARPKPIIARPVTKTAGDQRDHGDAVMRIIWLTCIAIGAGYASDASNH